MPISKRKLIVALVGVLCLTILIATTIAVAVRLGAGSHEEHFQVCRFCMNGPDQSCVKGFILHGRRPLSGLYNITLHMLEEKSTRYHRLYMNRYLCAEMLMLFSYTRTFAALLDPVHTGPRDHHTHTTSLNHSTTWRGWGENETIYVFQVHTTFSPRPYYVRTTSTASFTFLLCPLHALIKVIPFPLCTYNVLTQTRQFTPRAYYVFSTF